MNRLNWVGVSALTLTLGACGGGAGTAEPPPSQLARLGQTATATGLAPVSDLLISSSSPKALAKPKRLSQASITASAFFNWAEQAFPGFFPGPEVDRSLPPFAYRYYPGTQIYLAVNGDLVYALGPITGNEVKALGKLADFACLVSPASCTPTPDSGAASDCFNPALYTLGASYGLDYQLSGAITGVTTTSTLVSRQTAFDIYPSAIESVIDTTTTLSAPADLAALGPVAIQTKEYGNLDGLDVLSYGSTTVSTIAGQVSTVTTINQPAARERIFALALGESSVTSYSETTSRDGIALPGISQVSETWTYLGQDSVSVPAGTFRACKFRQLDGAAESFLWLSTFSGVPLKTQEGGGTITMELLGSSRLNGSPIAPQ